MLEIYYIPAVRNDEDYEPSWTGNNAYPTISIRGIFDSEEKAKENIKGWRYENSDDIEIIEYYFEPDEEDNSQEETKAFNINYDYKELTLIPDNEHGYYEINEIVDESYSEVWDEDGALGVTDY